MPGGIPAVEEPDKGRTVFTHMSLLLRRFPAQEEDGSQGEAEERDDPGDQMEAVSARGGHGELRLIHDGEGHVGFGLLGERTLEGIVRQQAVAGYGSDFRDPVAHLSDLGINAQAGRPAAGDEAYEALLASDAVVVVETMNVSGALALKDLLGVCERNSLPVLGCVTLTDVSKY